MPYDSKFGLQAQTPAQRTLVLQQMKAANPSRYLRPTPYEQDLQARYITGELNWQEVEALRVAQ